jgi:hypothetical protein
MISSLKNILIKITIALITICVLYSVFWFFKIGQMEKQINHFVSENASNVSIVNFEISGYPFAQNIEIENLRFNLPTNALNKYQIVIAKLKAKASIFDSNFDIEIAGSAQAQDKEGKIYNIIFNKNPEIKAGINDGFLQNFSYQDSGHKVFDSNQNLIYSADSSSVTVSAQNGENGEINLNINSNISQITNFGIFDIYKNAFEDKLINAINTGQIALNNELPQAQTEVLTAENNNQNVAAPANVEEAAKTSETAIVKEEIKEEVIAEKIAPTTPESAKTQSQEQVAAPLENQENSAAVKEEVKNQEQATLPMPENIDVKTNVSLNMQYILTPNQVNSDAQTPLNIAQIQESSMQYSKALKIDNLNIENALYKISVNGVINIFSDDTMPSGQVSVRLEKFSDIIIYVNNEITKIARTALVNSVNQPENLAQEVALLENSNIEGENKAAPATENQAENASVNNENILSQVVAQEENLDKTYHEFLNKISASLTEVAAEISTKNAATSGDIAQFEIKREKNLEFLVNETPAREILGKF